MIESSSSKPKVGVWVCREGGREVRREGGRYVGREGGM